MYFPWLYISMKDILDHMHNWSEISYLLSSDWNFLLLRMFHKQTLQFVVSEYYTISQVV